MQARTSSRWPVGLRGLFVLGIGFSLGQWGLGSLVAEPPQTPTAPSVANPSTPPASDYSQRVVAYIHGNIPITREELGEYLIQRHGAERLELLVNKRIIELAAQKQGIDVTPQEIEAALQEDLEGVKLSKSDFVKHVLKQYNKTLFEWKEDVIKPRLLLGKMYRSEIKVEEEDLRKVYENRYGKKVKCRMILWSHADARRVQTEVYDRIRKSEEEFDREARKQMNPVLASKGGEVAPIARYGIGDNTTLEEEAFKLQPGDVSRILTTREGILVIKCDAILPAENVDFEKVRPSLEKEVIDRKLTKEVPAFFKKLQDEARPQLFLKSEKFKALELEESAARELNSPKK